VVCASGWTATVVAQDPLPGGLNLVSPEALALYGGLLYVADLGSGTGALFSINLSNGSAAEVNGPATGAPVSLAVVDGGLLIGNTGEDIWFESLPGAQGTDLVTDSQMTFDFGGLAANAAGTAYYIDTEGPVGCFYSFNYQSGATSAAPYGDGGCPSGFLNGPIDKAEFSLASNPQALAFDPSGALLYVADEGNNLIRTIDLASGQVTTLAGAKSATADADGPAGTAGIVEPLALAVDAAGDVFVAEASGSVREITLTPSVTVQTLYDENCGSSLSIGTDAPVGLAVDAAGKNVYVSDSQSIAVWGLSHP
jgi:DNA-binding beta-propeller fold protein YncE